MEPEGILNACTINALIRMAKMTAITIASEYSWNSWRCDLSGLGGTLLFDIKRYSNTGYRAGSSGSRHFVC